MAQETASPLGVLQGSYREPIGINRGNIRNIEIIGENIRNIYIYIYILTDMTSKSFVIRRYIIWYVFQDHLS